MYAFDRSFSGFTLIELLVAIAIIGVLMGLVIVVLDPAHFQNKAQDSRRISNLAEIQTALELSFADNNQYPGTLPAGSPTDPDGGSYDYCFDATFMNYVICATMETTPLPDDCTGAAYGCSAGADVCCLTNPF